MNTSIVKNQIAAHLDGGEAFLPVQNLIDTIPFNKTGIRPHNLPYSLYELFYHIVFAQKDILDYCVEKNYSAANWPDDYWPVMHKPQNEQEWEDLKTQFLQDRESLRNFITSEENALDDLVLNSTEHTIIRQVMLVIEHNAYHTGQLLLLCRLLEIHDN
ncbi:DinB family protein [uncultured Christiangramia sp.]|uniref:DinB family protein n=1 Tax=Christiangramia sp. 3-2217-3z TaxID=3417564 RepID=UPI00262C4323|nr:DinB family protein [uncultured Christiangramia sp.]